MLLLLGDIENCAKAILSACGDHVDLKKVSLQVVSKRHLLKVTPIWTSVDGSNITAVWIYNNKRAFCKKLSYGQ